MGPVINVSPRTSSAYTAPTFSALAQGMINAGNSLGSGLTEFGRRRRDDRRKAQEDAALKAAFGAYSTGGQDAVMQSIMSGAASPDTFRDLWPVISADREQKRWEQQMTWDRQKHNAVMAQARARSQAATDSSRETAKDVTGRLRYKDTGEYVFDIPDEDSPAPDLNVREKAIQSYMEANPGSTFMDGYEATAGRQPSTTVNVAGDEAEQPEILQLKRAYDAAVEAGDQETADLLYKQVYGDMRVDQGKAAVAANAAIGAADALAKSVEEDGIPLPLSKTWYKQEQLFSALKLEIATLQARGAHFTETEQAMVDRIIGGTPTDLVRRIASGDEAYRERIQTAIEMIKARAHALQLQHQGRPTDEQPKLDFSNSSAGAGAGAGTAESAQAENPITPDIPVEEIERMSMDEANALIEKGLLPNLSMQQLEALRSRMDQLKKPTQAQAPAQDREDKRSVFQKIFNISADG